MQTRSNIYAKTMLKSKAKEVKDNARTQGVLESWLKYLKNVDEEEVGSKKMLAARGELDLRMMKYTEGWHKNLKHMELCAIACSHQLPGRGPTR